MPQPCAPEHQMARTLCLGLGQSCREVVMRFASGIIPAEPSEMQRGPVSGHPRPLIVKCGENRGDGPLHLGGPLPTTTDRLHSCHSYPWESLLPCFHLHTPPGAGRGGAPGALTSALRQ